MESVFGRQKALQSIVESASAMGSGGANELLAGVAKLHDSGNITEDIAQDLEVHMYAFYQKNTDLHTVCVQPLTS